VKVKDAILKQKELAAKILLKDDFNPPKWIGGMDVSCNLYDPKKMIYAAVVVLDAKTMDVVERAAVAEKQTFPYVPGLLGFREAPALVHAFEKLTKKPDLILVDGHGISHPRGLGIASHIGAVLNIPTIGVAKSILVGEVEQPLSEDPGSQAPLTWKNQTIAMAYRSKARCNPLYISAGHRITLASAVKIVERCLKKYRLPEPTRQAHLAANSCRLNFMNEPERAFCGSPRADRDRVHSPV